MAQSNGENVFIITDGKQFLGSRATPTTYGHDLVYMTPNGPATDLGKELTVLQLPDAVVREVEPDSEPEPLYHQPKAYVRYSTLHSPDDIASDDEGRVIYEVDTEDEAWLDAQTGNSSAVVVAGSNGHASSSNGHHTVVPGVVDVDTFEWMMQWLERKAFVAHQKNEMFSTRHAVQYDDTPCAVCREKESDDVNQIVICDGCEMAVHQNCYGVRAIPDGAWLCDVCSRNLDPAKVICDLCGGTGGAFKPLEKPTASSALKAIRFAPNAILNPDKRREPPPSGFGHVQCALWLPHTSFASKDCFGSIIVRFGAKSAQTAHPCLYCSRSRGSTIKCAHPTCNTTFHVLCAQKRCCVLIKNSLGRHIAYCEEHTPDKYREWRREALKTSTRVRISKRRSKKLNASAKSSALLKTASRRSDLASLDSLRYWSGLLTESTVKSLLQTMDRLGMRKFSYETVLSVFKHWTRRRTQSKGMPLLKALHPSNVDCNGTVLLNMTPAKDVPTVYARLVRIRNHLQLMLDLTSAVLERERILRSKMMAKLQLYENIINPVRTAQIHVLRFIVTDYDTKQIFERTATNLHPYDWQTVMQRLQAGEYDHDAQISGGGSFFADLLKVVDPEQVASPLRDEAVRLTEMIKQLQFGNIPTIKRTPHPLSIILPTDTVIAFKQAIQKMESSDSYRDML